MSVMDNTATEITGASIKRRWCSWAGADATQAEETNPKFFMLCELTLFLFVGTEVFVG